MRDRRKFSCGMTVRVAKAEASRRPLPSSYQTSRDSSVSCIPRQLHPSLTAAISCAGRTGVPSKKTAMGSRMKKARMVSSWNMLTLSTLPCA